MFRKTLLIAFFATFFGQPIEGLHFDSTCDAGYQCFGLPTDCAKNNSCDILVRTQAQKASGDVQFEMYWVRRTNISDRWAGVALSSDNMMGNDSATVFIIGSDGKVGSEQGLTFVNKKEGKVTSAGVKPVTVGGIKVQKLIYNNGVIYAKWSRAQKTSVGPLSFDMKANKYFIFLALGPVDKDGNF